MSSHEPKELAVLAFCFRKIDVLGFSIWGNRNKNWRQPRRAQFSPGFSSDMEGGSSLEGGTKSVAEQGRPGHLGLVFWQALGQFPLHFVLELFHEPSSFPQGTAGSLAGCQGLFGMAARSEAAGNPSLWSKSFVCPSAEHFIFLYQVSSGHSVTHNVQLLVWNHSSLSPVQQYTEHLAAVKAIAWSPHQHGLLASGGGTADRCIRFWNTLTGQPLQCIDTGSQVCNLAWSKHANELVSTHGYSQNQILVWKYPSLTQVAKLTGHSYRVLYLAMSPDGEAIVTGAGDETLRFWNVFSKTRSTKESVSVLNLFTRIR
ncbi:fizzy-related protein homolog [Heteronotia binoei]|uniref:fizzy-related protein homolog n=1 Tax=Heteronotia binoei TaxID=13085 RepID=UPI002930C267|nr:fizzy-related protein homolog [Heteronotia binoei]